MDKMDDNEHDLKEYSKIDEEIKKIAIKSKKSLSILNEDEREGRLKISNNKDSIVRENIDSRNNIEGDKDNSGYNSHNEENEIILKEKNDISSKSNK